MSTDEKDQKVKQIATDIHGISRCFGDWPLLGVLRETLKLSEPTFEAMHIKAVAMGEERFAELNKENYRIKVIKGEFYTAVIWQNLDSCAPWSTWVTIAEPNWDDSGVGRMGICTMVDEDTDAKFSHWAKDPFKNPHKYRIYMTKWANDVRLGTARILADIAEDWNAMKFEP